MKRSEIKVPRYGSERSNSKDVISRIELQELLRGELETLREDFREDLQTELQLLQKEFSKTRKEFSDKPPQMGKKNSDCPPPMGKTNSDCPPPGGNGNGGPNDKSNDNNSNTSSDENSQHGSITHKMISKFKEISLGKKKKPRRPTISYLGPKTFVGTSQNWDGADEPPQRKVLGRSRSATDLTESEEKDLLYGTGLDDNSDMLSRRGSNATKQSENTNEDGYSLLHGRRFSIHSLVSGQTLNSGQTRNPDRGRRDSIASETDHLEGNEDEQTSRVQTIRNSSRLLTGMDEDRPRATFTEDDETKALKDDVKQTPLSSLSCWERYVVRAFLRPIVKSASFEVIACAAVIMNCIQIGVESDAIAQRRGEDFPQVEYIFCLWFSIELLLRLGCAGIADFFCGDHRYWNGFDCVLVFFQILQEATESTAIGIGAIRLARMLRLLRLVRIARLLRVVRFIQDMKTITVAMLSAFSALTWTMVLLFMILYIFSIVTIQIISMHRDTYDEYIANLDGKTDAVEYYFGSLGRAMLTMFECIVGGISWDLVVSPLMDATHPAMGFFFAIYIIVTVYAITNMMTGMFVQKAMQFAVEHSEQYSADCIRDLWFKPDDSGQFHDITYPVFAKMLNDNAMTDYFKALNVDTSESKLLFDLLDEDGSGELEPHEIVSGCMRLRGPAKALNLAMLMRKVAVLVDVLENPFEFEEDAEDEVEDEVRRIDTSENEGWR